MKEEREQLIFEYLKINKSAKVDELAKKFNVNNMTIRRDLKNLEKTGDIKKIFGGAMINKSLTEELDYVKKSKKNTEEKLKIALEAVKLIKEEDVIILDSGTTTLEVAKKLLRFKSLTIITVDIFIAAYLIQNSEFKVYIPGGIIQKSTGTVLGISAYEFLKKLNADIAFIGSSFIDESFNIISPTIEKLRLKRVMFENAEKRIFLADSSKFEQKGFSKDLNLEQFNLIITDNRLENKVEEKFKMNNINYKLV